MGESLREQLEANYDQIVTREDEPETTPEVETTTEAPAEVHRSKIAEAPKATEAVEAKPDHTGRLHAPDGKFVEKTPKEPAATAAKAAATSPSSSSAVPAKGESPAAAAVAPKPKPQRPSSWKKDYWAHWDKLTSGEQLDADEARALAEYMNSREADFQHGVAAYKREWESARPVLEALQPFMPLLQSHGIQPTTWIQNLGNAHRMLAMGGPQEKLQIFARLAQDYGVPLQALTDPQAQQQYVQTYQPPRREAQPMPQNVLTREDADRLFQERFTALQAEQEVQRVFADTEKYPYIEEVRETMSQLLEAGLADDLPSAYQAALRHPRHSELWDAIERQRRDADAEAQRAAEAQRLARAKGRAVSTRSSTPSAEAAESPKGLRPALENAWNQHVGGGGRV